MFDFDAVPMVAKAQTMATPGVGDGCNIPLFGPPGVGQSQLPTALGLALVENGWRVMVIRTTDLVQRRQPARKGWNSKARSPSSAATIRSSSMTSPTSPYALAIVRHDRRRIATAAASGLARTRTSLLDPALFAKLTGIVATDGEHGPLFPLGCPIHSNVMVSLPRCSRQNPSFC